jgi:hypothetical protein
MSSFESDNKLDILFKKNVFNTTSVDITKKYYEERLDTNKRNFIVPEQIWSNGVPDTAPNLQYTEEEAEGITNPIPGVSSPSDYTHIKKYIKITLEHLFGSNGKAYYSSSLINSIPFIHDVNGSYIGTLYRNDGITEIPFGDSGGNWIIDNTSGILTFHNYDTVSGYVDSENPPIITFWKYDGDTGLNIGVSNNIETNVPILNGGNSTGDGDNIQSVIIDDRAVGSFLTTAFSRALQFGGNNEGSWRVLVRGGGAGTPNESTLLLQKRTSTPDVWETKHMFK